MTNQNVLLKDSLEFDFYPSSSWKVTNYSEHIVAYKAGFIFEKIVLCQKFRNTLEMDEIYIFQYRNNLAGWLMLRKLRFLYAEQQKKKLNFCEYSGTSQWKYKTLIRSASILYHEINVIQYIYEFGDHLYDEFSKDSHCIKRIQFIWNLFFQFENTL